MEVPEGALHPAVATGEDTGAHNGVALIIEQQEPQQCEEQDTLSIGQIHLQLMLASILPININYLAGPTELNNRFEEETAGIVGELAQILPYELCSAKCHFKEV